MWPASCRRPRSGCRARRARSPERTPSGSLAPAVDQPCDQLARPARAPSAPRRARPRRYPVRRNRARSSRTRSTVSTMPRNGSRPAVNAATHSSLAALKTAGRQPPGPAGLPWPARPPGTPRRPAAELQVCARVQSTGRRGVRHPVRPAQRQRDRQPHVRRAGLRERRPVDELDHRVDHRLRVHHHLDVVVRRRRTAGAPRSPRDPC